VEAIKVLNLKISRKLKNFGGFIKMKLKDMEEILKDDLEDPEYVAIYLNDALQFGSLEEFLLALKNVAAAKSINSTSLETDSAAYNLDNSHFDFTHIDFAKVCQIISALGLQITLTKSA